MKKIIICIPIAIAAIVLSFAFIPTGDTMTELAIGAVMPKGTVKMQDAVTGKSICLNDVKKENGLIVIFSCNTCPFVGKYEDRMKECYEAALKAKIGFI